jgi:hypothetical protein
MSDKATVTIEEAAELMGMSVRQLKVSRQRGLPPGNLGFVESGQLRFRRADLLTEPKTQRAGASSKSAGASPTHLGGGWYELSDGSRVRGKDAAARAQRLLG